MSKLHVALWVHAALQAVHFSEAFARPTDFDTHLLLSAGADFCKFGSLWRGWAMADGDSSSTAMATGREGSIPLQCASCIPTCV